MTRSAATTGGGSRDELGDWLLDASMRRIGLQMIAAVDAAIHEDDQHTRRSCATWGVSPKMRIRAAMTLLATSVMVSDDPEELLNRVRPMLIDRPPPPLPE
jgi:hypothetical protein